MQTFPTGATRSSDAGKNDYEGFLNPLVIKAFGDYMTKHRVQADGGLRASDNWQKGMTFEAYMKSLWRHVHDLWTLHRGYGVSDQTDGHQVTKLEACCAILFNTMGYMNELIKEASTEKAAVIQYRDIAGQAIPTTREEAAATFHQNF